MRNQRIELPGGPYSLIRSIRSFVGHQRLDFRPYRRDAAHDICFVMDFGPCRCRAKIVYRSNSTGGGWWILC